MYISSKIEQQKDGLWYCEIVTSSLYFFRQIEHTKTRTINDAKEWLLERRCSELTIKEHDGLKKQVDEFIDNLKPMPIYSEYDSESE
jgi:hypothetical protein